MKKVILLFVAVMISSVLWAQQWADATVKQLGENNKAMIDQTQAYGGGDYMLQGYKIASGTDAKIDVKGNDNQTYIKQVGEKNYAGTDIKVNRFDPCEGFCASNEGTGYYGVVSFTTSDIEVACCEPVAGDTYTLNLRNAWVMPGIYVDGNRNVATIKQDGSFLLAGIAIHGDDNTAGIKQKGSHNYASIFLDGDNNKSIVKQMSGSQNEAYVAVVGHDNMTGVKQTGHGANQVAQSVDGNFNNVFAKQGGCGENLAIQKVEGDFNNVLLEQCGFGNKSVQITTGSQNNSWVTQHGMNNESTVLQ